MLEFNDGPYTHARAFVWDTIYDRFRIEDMYAVEKPFVHANIPRPPPLPLRDNPQPVPRTTGRESRATRQLTLHQFGSSQSTKITNPDLRRTKPQAQTDISTAQTSSS